MLLAPAELSGCISDVGDVGDVKSPPRVHLESGGVFFCLLFASDIRRRAHSGECRGEGVALQRVSCRAGGGIIYCIPTVDKRAARASFVCSVPAGEEGGEGGGGREGERGEGERGGGGVKG